MTDIFLSYASQDLERVKPLASALSSEGWSVFYDRAIPPGKTWRDHISKKIEECRCMVVCWSSYSVKSSWVLEEADIGKERQILIPLFLDSIKTPLGFSSIHCANLVDWQNDTNAAGYLALTSAVTELIGSNEQFADHKNVNLRQVSSLVEESVNTELKNTTYELTEINPEKAQASLDIPKNTSITKEIEINKSKHNNEKNSQNIITLRYLIYIISFLAISVLTISLYLAYTARVLAIEMFYEIKKIEVSMAKSEITLERSAKVTELVLEKPLNQIANSKGLPEQELIRAEQEKISKERERIAQERQKIVSMKAKYEEYVKAATSYRFRFLTDADYEKILITKVASELGESELEVPDGFVEEVRKYIKYWQSSPRMSQAIARLEKNNYAPDIIAALNRENLPYQFLYLPLLESNFNTFAIGPENRYGIAKGAWQFIPSMASQYGLTVGPLANTREYDEHDDRFNFTKATKAGAKYLKYIYSTEAQASGLLVMAGYNYGHNRVSAMIRKMPDNPRDKNFWKFIQQYNIPKDTYDYVFYIFAAAVIGEDPKYFGFSFRSPTSRNN